MEAIVPPFFFVIRYRIRFLLFALVLSALVLNALVLSTLVLNALVF